MKPLPLILALFLASSASAQHIIDFGGTWCGPCQQMKPVVTALQKEGIDIREIDPREDQATAQKFNVTSVPCFVAIDAAGNEVDRITGFTSAERLRGLYARAKGGEQQVPPGRWPDPTIVQLDGGYAGALIEIGGDRNYILTCGHGPEHNGAEVTVTNRYGKNFRAVCVDCNEDSDVAILKIQATAQFVAPIAAGPPAIGTPVRFTGFGGGRYATKAMTAGYSAGTINEGRGQPVPGDSGGPVKNANGEIVGVISGTTFNNDAYYAQLKAIKAAIYRVECQYYPRKSGSTGGYPPAHVVVPPPIYQPQQDPPLQPVNPPLVNQPPGKSCTCAEDWAAFEQWKIEITAELQKKDERITQLELQLSEQNFATTVNNQVEIYLKDNPVEATIGDQQLGDIINQYFTEHPVVAPDVPTVDQILDELANHETPIRVYFPNGNLAGEAKTNLFKTDGSIDFTFNPRALLDEAKRQAQ